MLKGMLKNMDADNVVLSTTGEQAIIRCSETPFDIIFIDYNLGTGRNGRQLFEELKERKLLPTHNVSVLVTGEAQSTFVVGAIEVHPDDYIVKPFSQNLLRQRVTRAWLKKQILLPLIEALEKEKFEDALNHVNMLLERFPRLRSLCLRYKADILFKLKQIDVLEVFLDEILKDKRINWALIYKARVLQHRDKFQAAIRFAKEAVLQSKFNIEAYDVITDCYLLNNEVKPAYDWIRSGIEKSPFSVPRQYKLSAVAKLNKDFEASIKACSQVVDLTSKSFKKDYRHLLNHIRNIIDICELEDDEYKKRKYNQEAVYAIQKSKHETGYSGVKAEDFEQICMARLDSANGKNYKAKRSFFDLSKRYGNKDYQLPTELLADSLSLMLKIGEYDKAIDYSKQIEKVQGSLDGFTQHMVKHAQDTAKDKIKTVRSLNRMGIEEYKSGNFHQANKLFEDALEIAPMNTGSALNQIQVLLSMIESEPDNRWEYIEKAKGVYRIIDGMPLNEGHSKRAKELAQQLESVQKSTKRK